MPRCVTAGGRPAFVVNVEVFMVRNGRWLLIRRGASEAHAPDTLSGVGGKVEPPASPDDHPWIIEETARREVLEEVGVDLTGVPLRYAESGYFTTDDGDPVVNITLAAALPADVVPYPASADEVAAIVWLTAEVALADGHCPPWTQRSLKRAVQAMAAEDGHGGEHVDRGRAQV